MTSKSPMRLAAMALTGAATIALACGGATAAQAYAPPVESGSYNVSAFTVLDPGSVKPDQALLEGSIITGNALTAAVLSLGLSCDDGQPHPLSVSNLSGEVKFRADLPIALVGHTCTVVSFPHNGQKIWFDAGKPDDDKGSRMTYILAQLVRVSKTGGL